MLLHTLSLVHLQTHVTRFDIIHVRFLILSEALFHAASVGLDKTLTKQLQCLLRPWEFNKKKLNSYLTYTPLLLKLLSIFVSKLASSYNKKYENKNYCSKKVLRKLLKTIFEKF